jgi:hypothetical protein
MGVSMLSATYSFERGETIAIPLRIALGDRGDVSAITAQARYARYVTTPIAPSLPISADFAIVETDDGWLLTIDAATSASLAIGYHLADARLIIAGGVIITDPIAIRITEPVTEAAP